MIGNLEGEIVITVWEANSPFNHRDRLAVVAWLKENGVDAKDVMAGCAVQVDGDLIRYTTPVKNGKGRGGTRIPRKNEVIREPRTAPLIVPWRAP